MPISESVKEMTIAQLEKAEKRARAIEDPVDRARALLAITVGKFRHRAGLHWNSLDSTLVSEALTGSLVERTGAKEVREAWAQYRNAVREQDERRRSSLPEPDR